MPAPTNTVTALISVGNREDLEDVIYRVAPEDTPLTSNVGKAAAKAVFHEWQTETLATPNANNAALEGDDIATLDAPNLTTRVGNYCQIVRKTGGVSGTEEIVNKAGRKSEMNRQKILKGIEAKRDLEARLIGNFASNAESGSTPRGTGGLLAWCVSNTSMGSGGANGGFSAGIVAAATNGTQRAFTEAMVKATLSSCFTNGGKPKQAYMGPTQKQEFSAFTGIAPLRKTQAADEMATIIGAADVYVSDFGSLTLIPHQYGLTRDCVLVDPEMVAVGTLRGWATEPLAKGGDSERFIMTGEKCLVVKNEKAHGVIRDLS